MSKQDIDDRNNKNPNDIEVNDTYDGKHFMDKINNLR